MESRLQPEFELNGFGDSIDTSGFVTDSTQPKVRAVHRTRLQQIIGMVSQIRHSLVRYIQYTIKRALFLPRKDFLVKTFLFVLSLLLIGVLFHPTSRNTVKDSFYIAFSDSTTVDTTRELAEVDLSAILLKKDFSTSPITQDIIYAEYSVHKLQSYVPNLNNLADPGRREARNDAGFADGPSLITSNYDRRSQGSVNCDSKAFQGDIQVYSWPSELPNGLVDFRKKLLDTKSLLSTESHDDKESEESDEQIVEKFWTMHQGNAIWLDREQCYLVFSTVVHHKNDMRGEVKTYMVKGQAFDRNWNELKGKRIKYRDLTTPQDMDSEIRRLDAELGITKDCEKMHGDPVAYNFCKEEFSKNHLRNEKKKERVINRYYATYPQLIDIPFDPDGNGKGPSQLRVILKEDHLGVEEPLLTFRMYDNVRDDANKMFAFFPHRKINPLVKFNAPGGIPENDWSPFFHKNSQGGLLTRGFIHFITRFNPIEVIRCSLDNGLCNLVFDKKDLGISADLSGLKAGTQFVPLPSELPVVEGRQIWLGIPKFDLKDCGCAKNYERPSLMLLIESNGIYHQELLGSTLDLGLSVTSWDTKSEKCDEKNILRPNSIAHWEIRNTREEAPGYDDYLVITVSEAEIKTKPIIIRGLFNYLLNLWITLDVNEEFEITEESSTSITNSFNCAIKEARNMCNAYGKTH